jgi:phospholipid/cholesterol/gamma-HCH transport system substrate-binding protein
MERQQLARGAALAAIVIAVVVLVIVLFTSGSNYVVHAQFSDAGQLVNGDLVTVAGHQVGSVGSIKLADDGLADVELNISDSSITPLRSSTLATIGQLSLTGVANRFVSLTPGASGSKIPSGGTLQASQTRGIVDLDILLDALNPQTRTSLNRIVKTGAFIFCGDRPPDKLDQCPGQTARQANESFHFFNPALSQLTALGREVVADKFALDRLVSSSADVATAVAARNGDLGAGVTSTAAWLREVASQRTALQDSLTRAPGVLSQGTAVLRDLDFALRVLNPALTDLQPVAPRLATLLTRLLPAANNAVPTIAGVEALVPSARTALLALPPAEKRATPAVRSLTSAIGPVTPILSGLRPYIPDFVAGFFDGVGGSGGGYYDANGHYGRISVIIQGGGTSLNGVLGLLGGLTGSLGPLNGAQSHLVARCPGGGAPPAPGGSNAWSTGIDTLPGIPPICNPANDQK